MDTGAYPSTPGEIRQQFAEWREHLVGMHPHLDGLDRRNRAASAVWVDEAGELDPEGPEGPDNERAEEDADLMEEIVTSNRLLSSEFEQMRALGIARIDDAFRDARDLNEDDLGMVTCCVDRADKLWRFLICYVRDPNLN
jgi:hypothetical protein